MWWCCVALSLWCRDVGVLATCVGIFVVWCCCGMVVSLWCGHVDVWVVFLWCVALSRRVVLFMVWRCLCGVVMLVWCGGAFVVW